VADARAAGAIAHDDIGYPQCRDLADAQSRLQHQLHHGIVAAGKAVRGSTRRAQQCMDLDIEQPDRLLVARGAHRPDIPRGVGGKGASAARPSAQTAQSIQPPIDGRRPAAIICWR